MKLFLSLSLSLLSPSLRIYVLCVSCIQNKEVKFLYCQVNAGGESFYIYLLHRERERERETERKRASEEKVESLDCELCMYIIHSLAHTHTLAGSQRLCIYKRRRRKKKTEDGVTL